MSEPKAKPRVTHETIEAKVTDVEYYRPEIAPGLTVAMVKMQNGFVAVGTAHAGTDFDPDEGERLAFRSAISRIHTLEVYALREANYDRRRS